jgi:hypothetical protein
LFLNLYTKTTFGEKRLGYYRIKATDKSLQENSLDWFKFKGFGIGKKDNCRIINDSQGVSLWEFYSVYQRQSEEKNKASDQKKKEGDVYPAGFFALRNPNST